MGHMDEVTLLRVVGPLPVPDAVSLGQQKSSIKGGTTDTILGGSNENNLLWGIACWLLP